ncbi:MAG: leucine-rich repeat domain-containing protein [Promethearchaeota archaeon]
MSVIYNNKEFIPTVENNLLTLNLSRKGIEDIAKLKNLENLTDLQVLNLSYNQIDKIQGLNNLNKLKKLDLSNNRIGAIEGLDNLINLKTLNLENNRFINIQGLENLVNLKQLTLGAKKASVGSTGKPKTKEEKFAHGIAAIVAAPIEIISGRPMISRSRKALFLNGKELVGVEKKIAQSDVKSIVAYCRVKLMESGYSKRLVPADSELVKTEIQIRKMIKKYDFKISRALKQQERLKHKHDYSQIRRV